MESAKTFDEDSLHKEQLDYLKQAKSVLSEDELQLIHLRFNAGLSVRATGDAFGIGEGAVKARQYRILKNLSVKFYDYNSRRENKSDGEFQNMEKGILC